MQHAGMAKVTTCALGVLISLIALSPPLQVGGSRKGWT